MSRVEDINNLNSLYIKFCEGHSIAQKTLYEKTSSRLFNYIIGKTNVSTAEAADLMQETWFKLWKACSTDHKNVNFDVRMYKTAHSLVIDYWRAKKAKKRTTSEVSLDNRGNKENESSEWVVAAEDITDDASVLYDLKESIRALSFEQRQAWILMQGGKSNEEIAWLTDSNVEAVRSRIRYANEAIKKYLS